MKLGLALLIFGAVLVYGAKIITKLFKWVSLLTLKIVGLLIAIAGVLYIFEII